MLKMLSRFSRPMALFAVWLLLVSSPAAMAAERIKIKAQGCGPQNSLIMAGKSGNLLPSLQHEDGSRLKPSEYRSAPDQFFYLDLSAKPDRAGTLAALREEAEIFGPAKGTSCAVAKQNGLPAPASCDDKVAAALNDARRVASRKAVAIDYGTLPYELVSGKEYPFTPTTIMADGTSHPVTSIDSSNTGIAEVSGNNKDGWKIIAHKPGNVELRVKSSGDEQINQTRPMTVVNPPVAGLSNWDWLFFFLLLAALILLAVMLYREWQNSRVLREANQTLRERVENIPVNVQAAIDQRDKALRDKDVILRDLEAANRDKLVSRQRADTMQEEIAKFRQQLDEFESKWNDTNALEARLYELKYGTPLPPDGEVDPDDKNKTRGLSLTR